MSAGETEAIVVAGPCSATDGDLANLLGGGVPDSAVTAWAGAYTIIRTTRPDQVTIWTDPAGACPVYSTRDNDGGLVWGSSSRALSSLAGGDVDEEWLATALVAVVMNTPWLQQMKAERVRAPRKYRDEKTSARVDHTARSTPLTARVS